MRMTCLILITAIGWFATSATGQDAASPFSNQSGQNTQSGLFGRVAQTKATKVRFVRFNPVSDEARNTIREDAAVLNHMIAKELPLIKTRSALGVRYFASFGNNEVVYDDHGLRFVYNVPVQLIPAETEQESASDNPDKSEWEKAKAELHHASGFRAPSGLGSNKFTVKESGMEYDEEYVERITKQIRTALSNAGNIRELSSDDMISVFVYGVGNNAATRSVKVWRVKWGELRQNGTDSPTRLEENSYFESFSGGSGTGTIYSYGVSSGGDGSGSAR